MKDFIGRTECSEDIVKGLIEFFCDNEKHHKKGITGKAIGKDFEFAVHEQVKESIDLTCDLHQLHQYDVWKDYKKHLYESLNKYVDHFTQLKEMNNFDIIEPINIQHYPIGGGYKMEHCERGGGFDLTIKRVLVFMTYLNDVEDGGTHFKYFNHTEKATRGKTIIWPSDWTHTHCGQISNTKPKIISTGWFSHLWDF